MNTVSLLVSRHALPTAALIALLAIACVAVGLLVFAVASWIGIGAPRLDGPELAPFRWDIVARAVA
jgi:hypothetical protein